MFWANLGVVRVAKVLEIKLSIISLTISQCNFIRIDILDLLQCEVNG